MQEQSLDKMGAVADPVFNMISIVENDQQRDKKRAGCKYLLIDLPEIQVDILK